MAYEYFIIDPSNQGGTDYTSINAFESNEQADLTVSGIIKVAQLRTSGGQADANNFSIDGWTTDESGYVVLSGINALTGVFDDSGTTYYLERSFSSHWVTVNQRYSRVYNLQVSNTGTGGCFSSSTSDSFTLYKNIILRNTSGTSSDEAFASFGTGKSAVKLINVLAYGFGGTNGTGFSLGAAWVSDSIFAYNCTAVNCDLGFESPNSSAVIKNCIASGIAAGFSTGVGSFRPSSDYNLSNFDDAPGANSISGVATFVDPVNNDYRLDESDTTAKDAGTDLTSDGVDTDITGTVRPQNSIFDIGHFEVEVAGTTTETVTHTLDGVTEGRSSESHTVDAVLELQSTESHTVDADVKRRTELTHNVDVAISEKHSVTHTVDADVKKRTELTHNVDAYLLGYGTITTYIVPNFDIVGNLDHTGFGDNYEDIDEFTSYDGNTVRVRVVGPNQSDTQVDNYQLSNILDTKMFVDFVRFTARAQKTTGKGTTGTVRFGPIFGATNYTSTESVTINWTNYNYTLNDNPHTSQPWTASDINNMDAYLRCSIATDGTGAGEVFTQVESYWVRVDWSQIGEGLVATHNIDTALSVQNSESHTLDAVLEAESTESHTLDAVLEAESTESHTLDALLELQATVQHFVDAVLDTEATYFTSHTIQSVLEGSNSVNATVDAVLEALKTIEHALDALIFLQTKNNFTVDALLEARKSVTHLIDARLLSTSQGSESHNVSAVLIGSTTTTHTVDGAISDVYSEIHQLSATLVQENKVTHNVNAVLDTETTSSVAHTVDAKLFGAVSVNFTTDVVLYQQVISNHNVDLVAVSAKSIYHSLDARLIFVPANSHLVDAVLKKTGVGVSYTIGAILTVSGFEDMHPLMVV